MRLNRLALRIVRFALRRGARHNLRDWTEYKKYEIKKDIDILGDGIYAHKIDIIYAKKENRIGKTIFDIHGGGYIYSYRTNNYEFASVFAAAGFDVVLLDYEHADVCKSNLTQLQTIAAQIKRVCERADEFGINLDKVFLAGDSAGGHFAMLLGEAAYDERLQKDNGIDLGGFKPSGVALNCPVYDYARMTQTPMLTKSARKFAFGKDYANEKKNEALCPRRNLSSLKIPLFLSSCKNDFIGAESLDLKKDADARDDIDLEYHYFDIDDPEVDHEHNVTRLNKAESIEINKAMIEFFLRN